MDQEIHLILHLDVHVFDITTQRYDFAATKKREKNFFSLNLFRDSVFIWHFSSHYRLNCYLLWGYRHFIGDFFFLCTEINSFFFFLFVLSLYLLIHNENHLIWNAKDFEFCQFLLLLSACKSLFPVERWNNNILRITKSNDFNLFKISQKTKVWLFAILAFCRATSL